MKTEKEQIYRLSKYPGDSERKGGSLVFAWGLEFIENHDVHVFSDLQEPPRTRMRAQEGPLPWSLGALTLRCPVLVI